MTTTEEKLASLGMNAAANKIKELKDKKRKLAIAYENYRFVTPEKITQFQRKLYQKTYKREGYTETFQRLDFTPVQDYQEAPPDHVLENLRLAIERKCFDSFEIAHIQNVSQRIPDPLLFGRIKDCEDRFFIDQWDDDVKIEDILKENEG